MPLSPAKLAPTTPLSEAAIRSALRDCYDPELPCNIVDLGLVYGIALTLDPDAPGSGIPGVPARYRVAVQITLTTPGCPAHTQIAAQIENRLAAFESVSQTSVELVWQPVWSPERITPEGRLRLGINASNPLFAKTRAKNLHPRKSDLVHIQ
ncbi:MAG: metal-sulfur cluster assembly factor [Acidobacteriaceae bacterium]|nr:metal-sulfur cluster assembly factor [Acidobacteriaceae bacterium]